MFGSLIRCTMASDTEKNVSTTQRKVCPFFVPNKKRFCRLTVGVGFTYCGEHIAYEKTESEEKNHERMPCPYDSRHSCFAHALKKHLKKCNARPTEPPSYISKNINKELTSDVPALRLADIDIDDLKLLLNKIKNVYEGLDDSIKEEILEHSILYEAIMDPNCGANSRKHLIQNSSLIGHFHKLDLTANLSIIEFGAGKGQLTYWVARTLPTLEDYQFVVIDRSTLRHKSENKIKEIVAENVHRYRVDIADLRLSQLPPVINTGKCAAVSKHLCGAATDLALRCLINGRGEAEHLIVSGIVVAVCCHHRCEWSSYTGKGFLIDSGFEPSDFSVMCGIASWATCGDGQKKNVDKVREDCFEEIEDFTLERKNRLGLNTEERAAYGRMCKELFDHGRRVYLEGNGYQSSLKYYVQSDVSPENVCLFAKLKT